MSYTIELNTLPRKARNELIEYYDFIVHKYSQKHVLRPKKAKTDFTDFLSAPIIIDHFIMPDREVRNAR